MRWRPVDNESQTIWQQIVNESVASTLKRIGGGIVNEMALPLRAFKHRVDGLQFQLIENWCLLKYCQLYSPNNVNIAHWGSEFLACTDNLRDFGCQNDVEGYVVKGRGAFSANRIFLPAAGYGRRSDFRDAGFYGGYRSSTPYSDSCSAWYLDFASDSYCPISVSSRFDGFSVRAVRGFAPQ